MKKLIILIMTVFFIIDVSANWELDEINKTVSMIGTHTPNIGFVTLSEGVHKNCVYQHLYFDISTDLGKSFHSTLLAAKHSQSKIRIGYTPPTTEGVCTLQLVAAKD